MNKFLEKRFPSQNNNSFFLSLSFLSIYAIFNYLKVDTSTDSLINKNLKFKIDQENLKKDFKILDNNILIKISGNKNEVNRVSKLIIEDLKNRNELMFYYSPSMDDIFKENFFVFLNENQKKNLISTRMKINLLSLKLAVNQD